MCGGAELRGTRDGQGRCLRPIAGTALEARWHCALADIKGRVLIGDAVAGGAASSLVGKSIAVRGTLRAWCCLGGGLSGGHDCVSEPTGGD